jgi:pimeloyl-ACP methyl ester carboxylesterase
MAPVARRLGQRFGVVEALQTAMSVDGQVEELCATISTRADPPVRLVGHSWGAWLSMMVAARSPGSVARLILVSSAVLEDRYARDMRGTIAARLSADDRLELEKLNALLSDPDVPGRSDLQSALFRLMEKTEFFDRDDAPSERFKTREGIFESVWPQAAALRTSGALLNTARGIRCPVQVFHGDYDPSPAEGVRAPLSAAVADLRFDIIKDCGHTPWLERRAKESFYASLEAALTMSPPVSGP